MSWVTAKLTEQEMSDWGLLVATIEWLIADNEGFGWDIVSKALGGPPEDNNPHNQREWLKENVEPAEVFGYLKNEFGGLPEVEPAVVEEARGGVRDYERYSGESQEKLKMLEWSDIADLPALPLAEFNEAGEPGEHTEYTEQEKQLGIALRKITKGRYAAFDLYGWGMHAYGTTPHEALSKLYSTLTGRIPYSSSGDIP